MSAVDELIAYVRAQLDEDERMALAADVDIVLSWVEVCYDETEDAMRHVRRWNRERVLADVAAKRAILDEHRPDTLPDGTPTGECTACLNDEMPCRTVRLLARSMPGGEGWREEWAA